jgi:hypothetical protein
MYVRKLFEAWGKLLKGLEGTIPRAHIGSQIRLFTSTRRENPTVLRVLGKVLD